MHGFSDFLIMLYKRKIYKLGNLSASNELFFVIFEVASYEKSDHHNKNSVYWSDSIRLAPGPGLSGISTLIPAPALSQRQRQGIEVLHRKCKIDQLLFVNDSAKSIEIFLTEENLGFLYTYSYHFVYLKS